MWIADAFGQFGERRYRRAHDFRCGDIDMPGHRAKHDHPILFLDASQFCDAREIDQHRGAGEPLLERRDERHATRQRLGIGVRLQECERILQCFGPAIVEGVHQTSLASAASRIVKAAIRTARTML